MFFPLWFSEVILLKDGQRREIKVTFFPATEHSEAQGMV